MSSPRRRTENTPSGCGFFEFGCQVEQSWDISSVARPYMEHLAQRTGASVVLSICESGSVITLDQVQPRSNLHVVSNVGARLPIYCTSQGKVFLAHMKAADAQKLLQRQTFVSFTPHTITDIPTLLQKLSECREAGYAIENGEYKIGLCSISAPVFTQDGTVGRRGAVYGRRDRHVPQHPLRRDCRRRRAGARHRVHDLCRARLSPR